MSSTFKHPPLFPVHLSHTNNHHHVFISSTSSFVSSIHHSSWDKDGGVSVCKFQLTSSSTTPLQLQLQLTSHTLPLLHMIENNNNNSQVSGFHAPKNQQNAHANTSLHTYTHSHHTHNRAQQVFFSQTHNKNIREERGPSSSWPSGCRECRHSRAGRN